MSDLVDKASQPDSAFLMQKRQMSLICFSNIAPTKAWELQFKIGFPDFLFPFLGEEGEITSAFSRHENDF